MLNLMLTIFSGIKMLFGGKNQQATQNAGSGGSTGTSQGAYDNTSYDVTDPSKLESFAEVAGSLHFVLKKIIGPVLVVIGVLATVYAIYLGVMYAKAEDANRRKELLGRLIGACIGAVIIIAGVVVCFTVNWSDVYFSFQGTHEFKAGSDGMCEYCGHNGGYKFHSVKAAG